jgi:hypothetical protein
MFSSPAVAVAAAAPPLPGSDSRRPGLFVIDVNGFVLHSRHERRQHT